MSPSNLNNLATLIVKVTFDCKAYQYYQVGKNYVGDFLMNSTFLFNILNAKQNNSYCTVSTTIFWN